MHDCVILFTVRLLVGKDDNDISILGVVEVVSQCFLHARQYKYTIHSSAAVT